MTEGPLTERRSSAEAGARPRIVAAAVALFAEQGFDATSVNQIVRRADVAKGALYHHFASKDDLLYEVYRELVDRQLSGMQEIQASGMSAAETLRAIVRDMVVTTAGRVAEATVFFREGHRLSDTNQQRVREARRAIHRGVISLVAEAQASGEFNRIASPDMVSFTIFGVINELPIWYRPDGPMTPDAIADELSDLVLAALTVGPETSTRKGES